MFPEITSTTALEYLQYANRELCFDMPLYTLEEDITLDGASNIFTLNSDDLRVWSAHYVTSATNSKPLDANTLRGMELDYSNYRNTPESVPFMYCVYKESDVLKLKLYPQPATATSSGYPKVTLRVSRHVDLTELGNIPSGLVAPDVYVLKAGLMYATDHGHVDRVKLYEAMLRDAIIKNLQGFDFKVVDAPPKTKPAMRFPSVRRR